MKFKRKLLMLKIEPTYGVDSAPTGAANAQLVHNLELNPMQGETINRDLVRSSLGNDLQIHVGTHVQMSFDIEIAGAGGAGVVPGYGPALRACALAETINAGVSVEYSPVSEDEESASLYLIIDGQKHAMVGARGSMAIDITPKGLPYYKFNFLGLWVDPASITHPAGDFTSFKTPIAVTNDNTPTFNLHGISPNMLALNLDQANKVVYRNVVGEESIQVVDREPSGSVTIEAPELSTKNYFTEARANTTGVLQLVHGVTEGNIVQIDCPVTQLLQPKYGDSDGITTLQMGVSVIPDVGDDEFKITVR